MRALLILLLLSMYSCGLRQPRPVAQVCDTTTVAYYYKPTTIEDTVRFQIGGKLFDAKFAPSDSLTVIKATYRTSEEAGLYREYQVIHHNRHSPRHRRFEPEYLDSLYKSYMSDKSYRNLYNRNFKPRMDSIRVEYITPEIKDFNGYWVYLNEYKGDYYLADWWAGRISFCIADSLYTTFGMTVPFPKKIRKALPHPGGIAIYHDKEEAPLLLELFDSKRSIYRLAGDQPQYVAPAKAIHNFEVMLWLNNMEDMF